MNNYITIRTQINKRDSLRCERDNLGGKPVVRILRLKPDASGDLRPAGPRLEFAERHLPSVITMLQDLQAHLTRGERSL